MEVCDMKRTTLAILLTLALVVMAVIGTGCSRSSSPVKSTFAAEHGTWFWLESVGGIAGTKVEVDSVDFNLYLKFTIRDTVWSVQVPKGTPPVGADFRAGYSISFETYNSEQVKVLRYEQDVHAPQAMEFRGRDTLILTDLASDGFTHKYLRLSN